VGASRGGVEKRNHKWKGESREEKREGINRGGRRWEWVRDLEEWSQAGEKIKE